MAKTKCEICNEEIKTTFLEKIVGTPIKIKTNDEEPKNEIHYICSACQKQLAKENKDPKKEIEKSIK